MKTENGKKKLILNAFLFWGGGAKSARHRTGAEKELWVKCKKKIFFFILVITCTKKFPPFFFFTLYIAQLLCCSSKVLFYSQGKQKSDSSQCPGFYTGYHTFSTSVALGIWHSSWAERVFWPGIVACGLPRCWRLSTWIRDASTKYSNFELKFVPKKKKSFKKCKKLKRDNFAKTVFFIY